MDEYSLDRRQLRAAFERAARGYDPAAVLQREVGARLLERLELTTLKPVRILDLGCGTGRQLRALQRRYPAARIVAADLAMNMLAAARRAQGWFRRPALACADALHLPFVTASFDLVYCNLMLQWCDELDRVFTELRRILKPHGLLLFSSFGPDTLKELRAAWRAVDARVHVHRFIDMHDIGDALIRTRFVEPVMDVEHLTLTYADLRALMADLKKIGAHNVAAGRPHSLGGRLRLRELTQAYELFRRDGRLPSTWEVVYGTAWTPAYIPADMLTPEERRAAFPEIPPDGSRS
ncbi:MAG: malonyl-ACP O-methyltransferase BioC [Gammaproteobacteria bacterium]|nr:malonyl-ACP O-methyltransferase BioC [Gammaproteobacteria bacterium]MBU6508880.1 malonyl-ACP O-methyltransferase BioC [Gammaproteobacteria bacterium]MDE1983742.1 malonyl-ACP O-methyltransferase BioC [Gammaproteobacteria bacterium]MDE2108440.1 malonyl-ACP O-methyltransferase BioC [Gammaproteobacteria bacterium]MDE2460820.1 malonyl-ACP O-methyltransferase BioC [Gammaproteobacteria bacterium]